jgi:glycosyltransferase 2 family protein
MPLWLRALAGFALFGALLWSIDLGATLDRLREVSPLPLVVAFVVSAIGVVVSAWKWKVLLGERQIRLPLSAAIRFYWIGMFFSNFLPTSVGGDAIRMTLARRHGSAHELAASILIERLTGLAVLLGVLTVGLLVHRFATGDSGMPHPVGLAVAAASLCILVALLVPRPLGRLCRRWRKRVPMFGHAILFAARLLHVTSAYTANRRALQRAILLSLPFYATIVAAHAGVLLAVGARVELIDILIAAPLVSLVSVFPLFPNGVGLAEGAFVLLYASSGVSPAAALAAAVLRRLVDLGNSSIGGVFWAWRPQPVRHKEVAQAASG